MTKVFVVLNLNPPVITYNSKRYYTLFNCMINDRDVKPLGTVDNLRLQALWIEILADKDEFLDIDFNEMSHDYCEKLPRMEYRYLDNNDVLRTRASLMIENSEIKEVVRRLIASKVDD